MSLLCRGNLTPLQRRSLQLGSVALILAVLTNFTGTHVANPLVDIFPVFGKLIPHSQPTPLQSAILAGLSVIPVLFAVWVVGRYLKAEPDEFIRSLVVRAVLWGFSVTMAGDAIVGVLTVVYARPFPLTVLNADLFLVTSLFAFRFLLWSYR